MNADAAWRRQNLGHLLFAATGITVDAMTRAAEAGGYPALGEARLGLIGRMDPDGTRLTVLAARAGVAKQSTVELVDRGVRAGLLTRAPDPADRRAKLVRLTPSGTALQRLLVQHGHHAADGFARAIGLARVTEIVAALSRYLDVEQASLDQLLVAAGACFVRDVLAAVHRHGYREVTEAMLSLFRHLDLAGTRLTELAAAARITKQSMGGLVTRAERLGLVERVPDPMDRRASLVRFTPAGLTMLDAFRDGVLAAERHFAQATGADLPALKASLSALIAPISRPGTPPS